MEYILGYQYKQNFAPFMLRTSKINFFKQIVCCWFRKGVLSILVLEANSYFQMILIAVFFFFLNNTFTVDRCMPVFSDLISILVVYLFIVMLANHKKTNLSSVVLL